MTTLAVIQARMGSTRFPGKMMAMVGGKPLVWHVLTRAKRLSVDGVVLATTTRTIDDPLCGVADALGVPVHRGSEDDVLGRIIGACDEHQCRRRDDIVVRVCGDSPLWDVGMCDRIVTRWRIGGHGSDVVCLADDNGRLGMSQGVDFVRRGALDMTPRSDPQSREHVCSWAREQGIRWYYYPEADEWTTERLSIDTPEDLERLRARIEEEAR
jgi:spore coat polysaccharide biosynthesis protein SpsF